MEKFTKITATTLQNFKGQQISPANASVLSQMTSWVPFHRLVLFMNFIARLSNYLNFNLKISN